MRPESAAHLTRLWTRVYTLALPVEKRERRRAEVESDLWESLAERQRSAEIFSRFARGILDDIRWSTSQMERHAREALFWTLGSFCVLALVVVWLRHPPDGEAMRTSLWRWPLTLIAHNLGVIGLIGLRLPVDLRLTTPLFGNLSISELVRRLMPATIAAAAVVVASGLALAVPAPDVLLANTLIRAKFVLLTLALINTWYLHTVTFRTIEQWDTVDVTPVAARISAVLSLTLWAAIVVSSLLAPFWPGWR